MSARQIGGKSCVRHTSAQQQKEQQNVRRGKMCAKWRRQMKSEYRNFFLLCNCQAGSSFSL